LRRRPFGGAFLARSRNSCAQEQAICFGRIAESRFSAFSRPFAERPWRAVRALV
jgi:hypothetical protein